ncbi:MAG TPA: hypothetical protein VIN72_07925 [Lutibacter sp.]
MGLFLNFLGIVIPRKNGAKRISWGGQVATCPYLIWVEIMNLIQNGIIFKFFWNWKSAQIWCEAYFVGGTGRDLSVHDLGGNHEFNSKWDYF